MSIKIIAHRGASFDYPENTIIAFEKAIEQGADGIELDVHLTADGQIVVHHDEKINRTSNGDGFINEMSLISLRNYNFNNGKTEVGNVKIPLLSDVYDLVKNKNIEIHVELKTCIFLYPELPQKLINLTRDFAIEERVVYSSFNHNSLRDLKSLNPKAEIALTYQDMIADPWVYAKYLNANTIHPDHNILLKYPSIVKECHKNDIKINTWTVDNEESINKLFDLEVDGLMTNFLCNHPLQLT